MARTAEEQKEYDAIYNAEMDKLNATTEEDNSTTTEADNSTAEPAAKEATKTDETATPAEGEPESLEARMARLEQELTGTKKALNDTKSWATKNAAEVKRLRKEREEEQRKASRPTILDDNPGLEEAISHVTGAKPAQPAAETEASWVDTVGTALPELGDLLEKNPELKAKAEALADTMGDDWNNPLIAIRELGRLQRDHERAVTSTAAREAAQRDFQQKGMKKTAMQMPSGSAARQPVKVDAVKDIQDMSDADFKKMRAKVLGYS